MEDEEKKKFWGRLFRNPMDLDLSMLGDKEFELCTKDLFEAIGERLKVDHKKKRIRIEEGRDY